jgi:muramidase (phage lysozyme)
LETIAGPESAGDYGVRYGGAQGPQHFSDFSKHPNVWVPIPGDPKGLGSTAAGKYQFIYSTWETARKALNLPDFSPESQDRAAAWLATDEYMRRTGHDLQADLASGDPGTLANIQRVLSAHWGTLLRSDYMARLKANIDKARGTRLGFNLPSSLNVPGSFNVASLDAALQPMQTATLTPTINQNTTIHVTGTRDPHATAQLVAREQSRVNADLLRNMKSAFA